MITVGAPVTGGPVPDSLRDRIFHDLSDNTNFDIEYHSFEADAFRTYQLMLEVRGFTNGFLDADEDDKHQFTIDFFNPCSVATITINPDALIGSTNIFIYEVASNSSPASILADCSSLPTGCATSTETTVTYCGDFLYEVERADG